MWRKALGTNGVLPTSVTDDIWADTDVGIDVADDWLAVHRNRYRPMLVEIGTHLKGRLEHR